VQPHPRRSHHHRTRTGQSPHRHHSRHPDHSPGTHRILGPATDPAPTPELAMGIGLEHPVQQPISTQHADPRLTRTPPAAPRHERPTGTTRHQGRAITHAHTTTHLYFKAHNQIQLHTRSASVHPGLAWVPSAVAELSAPVAFACEPWPVAEAVAVPCCTRTTPLVATAMFCPGAFGFAEDEEAADDVSDDEDEPESEGLAVATHG